MRDRVGLEGGFLADQAGGKHGIKIIALGFAAELGLIRKRKKDFPDVGGGFVEFAGIEIRDSLTRVSHSGGEMAFVEGRLCRFDEETRRRGGGISRLEFKLGRSVECDGTE